MTKRTRTSTKRSTPPSRQPDSTALSVVGGDGAEPKSLSLRELPAEQARARLTAAASDAALARNLVAANPALAGIMGGATTHAQCAWLDRWAGEDELTKAAMRANASEIETKLLGPNPSQIERLLAGRVALCWLEANYFDARAGRQGGSQSVQQAEFDLKQQDRAHRRYLSALKAFAEVRRLLIPAVQVNIADKQLNVAGNVEAPVPRPP